MRPYLRSIEPTISKYPHNLVFLFPQLDFTVRQLQKMSVAEVALAMQKATDDHRGLPYIQISNKFLIRKGGSLVLKRSMDVDAWFHSNQTIARTDSLAWGSEVFGIWHIVDPLFPEKGMSLHQFRDGFMMSTSLRRVHWRSIRRELHKLNMEQVSESKSDEAKARL